MKKERLQSISRLAVLMVFLASPVLSARLDPQAYVEGPGRKMDNTPDRGTSAVGLLMGELREAVAELMYVKTERYLHAGVGYISAAHQQPTVHADDDADARDDPSHGHHHDEPHLGCRDGTPTIIRNPNRDFRGYVGVFHRAVQPWHDPSVHVKHTDAAEILPWYRLMTLTDPHYVRGYVTGGWWLKSRDPEQALKFLEEGIRKNPNAFQIYLVRGQVLIELARRTGGDDLEHLDEAALAWCLDARDAFREAARLGIAQRPASWVDDNRHDDWSDSLDDDVFAAARMAVLLERRFGSADVADNLLVQFARNLPDDAVLARMVRGLGE